MKNVDFPMKNGGFPHFFSHKNGESFEQRTASLLPGSLPRPWLPRLPEGESRRSLLRSSRVNQRNMTNHTLWTYLSIYIYIHGGFPKWGYPISSSIYNMEGTSIYGTLHIYPTRRLRRPPRHRTTCGHRQWCIEDFKDLTRAEAMTGHV